MQGRELNDGMGVMRKHTRHSDSEIHYMLLEIKGSAWALLLSFPTELVRIENWADITCNVPQASVRSDGNLVRQEMLLAFSLLQGAHVDFQNERSLQKSR